MKKLFIICVVLTLFLQGVSGQQRDVNCMLNDKAPSDVHKETPVIASINDAWDLQFTFPIEDTTQGIETDGQYIYITNWRDTTFKKYDLQGNLVEYFRIPGACKIRDLAYDGQYFYGGNAVDSVLFIMDFDSRVLIDSVSLSFPVRGIAYNPTNDVFYSNNWDQSYIYEFDLAGNISDSIQASEYGWTYGYAYDGWSAGGPFLWGFSQYNNTTEAIITQYNLRTKEPTGFYMDLSYLVADTTNIFAGGLFTHQDLVTGTVTLGGLIQNDLVFGFELASLTCASPINLSAGINESDVTQTWTSPANQQLPIYGYNIYRNNTLLNSSPLTDTVYYDLALPIGIHNYYVTALYLDDLGNPACESEPSNIEEVAINPATNTLGGNVIAGQDKMYFGHVNAYLYGDQGVTTQYTSEIIDTLGYYFFLPYSQNDYYIQAIPKEQTEFADTYVPTYHGNTYHWEDASTVFLEEDVYDANIDMISAEFYENGMGILQGKISNESLSEPHSSANDILVLLLNELNECIAYQFTDQNGNFDFSSLSTGTYHILVEIVGKEMNPATFRLDSDLTTIDDIYFVISESEIALGINETLPHFVNFISELFPNPATGKIQINISSKQPTQVSVRLFDMQNRAVLSDQKQLNIGTNNISLAIEDQPGGVYYVQIYFENGQSIIRKVIILE